MEPTTCNVCSAPAPSRCKKCKAVYYCSTACQAKDWSAHRTECSPLPRVWRHCTFHFIEPGSVILEEPIFKKIDDIRRVPAPGSDVPPARFSRIAEMDKEPSHLDAHWEFRFSDPQFKNSTFGEYVLQAYGSSPVIAADCQLFAQWMNIDPATPLQDVCLIRGGVPKVEEIVLVQTDIHRDIITNFPSSVSMHANVWASLVEPGIVRHLGLDGPAITTVSELARSIIPNIANAIVNDYSPNSAMTYRFAIGVLCAQLGQPGARQILVGYGSAVAPIFCPPRVYQKAHEQLMRLLRMGIM